LDPNGREVELKPRGGRVVLEAGSQKREELQLNILTLRKTRRKGGEGRIISESAQILRSLVRGPSKAGEEISEKGGVAIRPIRSSIRDLLKNGAASRPERPEWSLPKRERKKGRKKGG